MDLLVFAHKGEAQEFIRQLSAKPLGFANNLYQAKECLILISGEGIYEAFSKLGPVLGSYEIKKALNFGIAATLDPQTAKVGEVLRIRTCYGFEDKSPIFHSYTTSDNKASVDIITAPRRVLSPDYAKALSPFAPVTDREAWAIGKLCSDQKLPFEIIKLISDAPADGVACLDIKNKALEYSQILFAHYEKNFLSAPEVPEESIAELPMPMSFSQRSRFLKIKAGLDLIDFDLESFNIHFESKELSPKARATKYLEELDLVMNPIKALVKERFDELSAPLTDIGARIIFDKAFEKKKFLLQMEVNDQKNLKNLKEALQQISFEDFNKVWDGEHVQ